jgi:hypothetical protein
MTLFYIAAGILAVVLMCVYVSWRAGRLDRLHHRVDAARTALDLALVRRSSSAYELASSGLLDPATSLLLADAARRTKDGPEDSDGPAASDGPKDSALRLELAESDLTRALRAAFGQPEFRESLTVVDGAEEIVGEVEAAAHQVFLARKFYNDLVSATRDARRRPLARALRLAGKAPAPVFFEMDDSLLGDLGPGGHTMVTTSH